MAERPKRSNLSFSYLSLLTRCTLTLKTGKNKTYPLRNPQGRQPGAHQYKLKIKGAYTGKTGSGSVHTSKHLFKPPKIATIIVKTRE